MGLDMYLYKKTYVKNWVHNGPDKQHKFTIEFGGKVRSDIKPERISYITEEVAYWRKFNALHGWFVQNCGGGVDECQEMDVSNKKMQNLLETLKKVSEVINKSEKIVKVMKYWNGKDYEVSTYDCEDEIKKFLPPTEGFFFGGYEIDEYYKDEVERTIEIIEGLLMENNENKDSDLFGGDFYYRASW